MRIINIITTENNNVSSVESFGVFEEQLSQDVVDDAEKCFVDTIKKNIFVGSDDDLESYIEDGFYEGPNGISVSLVWSDI